MCNSFSSSFSTICWVHPFLFWSIFSSLCRFLWLLVQLKYHFSSFVCKNYIQCKIFLPSLYIYKWIFFASYFKWKEHTLIFYRLAYFKIMICELLRKTYFKRRSSLRFRSSRKCTFFSSLIHSLLNAAISLRVKKLPTCTIDSFILYVSGEHASA